MRTPRHHDPRPTPPRTAMEAGLFDGRTRRLKWSSGAMAPLPAPIPVGGDGKAPGNGNGNGDGNGNAAATRPAAGDALEHLIPQAGEEDHPLRLAFDRVHRTGEPATFADDGGRRWVLGPVPHGDAFDVLVQHLPPLDDAPAPELTRGGGRSHDELLEVERALEARVRQQRAIAELGQFALTVHDPQELFNRCVEEVAQVLEIELTKVLELLPDGHALLLRAGVGWREGLVGNDTVLSDKDSQAGFTLMTNEPVVVEDLRTETRFKGPSLLLSHDVISGMSCIIIGPGDKPWGVIGVHSRRPRKFAEDDVAFLRAVANILGSAVQRAAMEAELRASEGRLSSLIQTLPAAVYMTDTQGRLTLYNPAAAKLWGREPKLHEEKWCGSHKVYHTDGTPMPLDDCFLAVALREGRAVEGAKVIIERPDGDRRLVLPHPQPMFDGQGRMIGAINLLLDVTEQRRAEQAVRQSEERLRELFEALPAAVYMCDTEGRITLCNSASAELWGEKPRLGEDVWHRWWKAYRPDGTPLPLEERPMAVCLQQGRPIAGQEMIVELGDGERRHLLSHPQPLFNADGRMSGAINMLVDVTRQKQAEQALRESERRYATLLSNLPGMAYRCPLRAPWPLQFASEGVERLCGHPAEDFMEGRRTWSDLLLEGDRKAVEREVEQSIRERRPFELAYPIWHRDGTVRWVLDRGRYVTDDRGEPVAIEGFVSDLTAQVQAQQALSDSEEQLRFTLESARVGTWDWDIVRDHVNWSDNLEQIHGLEPGTFGKSLESVIEGVHPDDRVRVRQTIERAMHSGGEYDVEYRLAGDGPPRWVEGKGRITFDDRFKPVRMSGICMDITPRKRADQMIRFLAESGSVLAGALQFEDTLKEVADLAVPTLADWCAVDLVDENGGMRLVAVSHSDPAKAALARRLREKFPPQADGHGAGQAIRSRRPVLFTEIDDQLLQQVAQGDAEHLAMLRELNLRSAVVIPLIVHDRVLGVLTLVSDHEQRRFTEQELPSFTEFARQCAQAMERARLYQDAQREIALRKQTEKALRDSERLYRAIGESIDYGIWVCDPQGRNVYASESFLKLVGKTQQQCSDFGWGEVLHPDDAKRTIEQWKKCVREQGMWNVEHRFLGQDGKYHPVLARGVPVRDDEGRVIYWAGINLDISDLKHAEYRARRQAKMLQRTVQTNVELAGKLERQSLLQAVTDAATELTGAQFGAFFHTATDEKGERFLLYTLSGVDPKHFEGFPAPRNTAIFAPTFRGDGPIRLDDVTKDPRFGRNSPHQGMPEGHLPVRSYLAIPVKLSNGDVLGGLFLGHEDAGVFSEQAEQVVIGIAAQAAVALDNARLYAAAQSELDERRRAERALRHVNVRLREKNEEMAQFVYTVSHDLKSPLVTTVGFVGMLKEDLAAKRLTHVDDSIGHIERAVAHMGELIDDLLQLSRIGRVELHLAKVDANEVARELERAFSLRLKEAGAALTIAPLPTVRADPTRLKQVLENFMGNALKYAQRPGLEVEIGGDCADGEARLFVRDNGPGIDPRYHEKIFGLFERLDRRHEGTGVGLAIVRRIMQVHGGRAWVESEPGRGATFWVAFPQTRQD